MPPRWKPLDLGLLVLVLAVAGMSRAWYVSECVGESNTAPLQVQGSTPAVESFAGPANNAPKGGRDRPTELDNLVHNLTTENWFGAYAPLAAAEESTAHVAPGYAWLLALARACTDSPDQADRVMRWLQVALGALTAAFYFCFARRAFASRRAGFLAGLLCALHPFWIFNTAELNDGALCSFLLGAVLVLGTRAGQIGGPLASLLFGLGLAGLAMVRAALLPFAVIALLWFLLRCRTIARGWFCALLAFLGFANGLAPWTVRNIRAFTQPVPVADSAFLHLWIGNNPQATGGPMDAAALAATLSEERLRELSKESNQAQRYNMLARDTAQAVAADPAGTIANRLWSGLYFIFGETWFTQRSLTALGTDAGQAQNPLPSWLAGAYPAILVGTLFAMLVLAFLGWRWSYPWRVPARLATLALLWLPLPYLLTHADTLSGPRLPLDGVLLCFCAVAISTCLPGGRASENADQ